MVLTLAGDSTMISCFAMRSPVAGADWAGDNFFALDNSNIRKRKSIPCGEFFRVKRYIILLLAFLAFLHFGCVRQNAAAPRDAKIWVDGTLKLPGRPDAPRSVYVDVRGPNGQPLPLSQNLREAVASGNYQIVENPSEAGYIMHVTVVQEGQVSPEIMQKLVKEGYGAKARFSGSGADGMLADVLLAQRRVPSAKRPGYAKLKNVSARNVLESAQMRLGVIIPRAANAVAAQRITLAKTITNAMSKALVSETVAKE